MMRAMYIGLEGMQRAQQEMALIANRINQGDPNLLNIYPIVDIEVINNGLGFKIIRRLSQESGLNTRNMQRPDMTPSDSRNLDWSILVGELRTNLNAVQAAYTVDNTSVTVTSNALGALCNAWNAGDKFCEMVSKQKVDSAYAPLSQAHNQIIQQHRLAESLQHLREEFTRFSALHMQQYDRVWNIFDVLQPAMHINDPSLVTKIKDYENDCTQLKNRIIGKNINDFSQNQLVSLTQECISLLNRANAITVNLNIFLAEVCKGLFNNLRLFNEYESTLSARFAQNSSIIKENNATLHNEITSFISSIKNRPESINQLSEVVFWIDKFEKDGKKALFYIQQIEHLMNKLGSSARLSQDNKSYLSEEFDRNNPGNMSSTTNNNSHNFVPR